MIRQLYHTFMGLFQRPDPGAAQAFGKALTTFQAKYPQRQVHENWYSVEKISDSAWIVTLVSGHMRPPERSWWRVEAEGEPRELSREEASSHIQIPLWR